MEQTLVTVEDAARALGVSQSTVWRLIQRGELPTVLRRGRRLVPASALRKRVTKSSAPARSSFSEDHPIFRLVGAGRGGGRTPGARDKHAILGE